MSFSSAYPATDLRRSACVYVTTISDHEPGLFAIWTTCEGFARSVRQQQESHKQKWGTYNAVQCHSVSLQQQGGPSERGGAISHSLTQYCKVLEAWLLQHVRRMHPPKVLRRLRSTESRSYRAIQVSDSNVNRVASCLTHSVCVSL